MTGMTFNAILARESAMLARPGRFVDAWEHLGHGHHVQVLLYEYDDPNLGTYMRLAMAVDGRLIGGLIVGERGSGDGSG